MEFKNLQSIIDSIAKWDQIRNNSADVVNYLGRGTFFNLKRDKPTASNLHAYPGIGTEDDELYFFIIDANADKSSSEKDLFEAITICEIKSGLGNGDEIPEIEAKRRIDKWDTDFASWATAQVDRQPQTPGIFKAFNIPSSYAVQNAEYSVFFGLKVSTSVTGYDADLITVDASKAIKAYYDTVRPVPPFDVFPQSSFYLLSLV